MQIWLTERPNEAIGPYSQAVKANGFVFVSGQIPAEKDGTIISGTIQEKTHKMCQNAKAVLEAAGSSLENVAQVTVGPFASQLLLSTPLPRATPISY